MLRPSGQQHDLLDGILKNNNQMMLATSKTAKKEDQKKMQQRKGQRWTKAKKTKSPVLQIKKQILANKQKANSLLRNQMEYDTIIS